MLFCLPYLCVLELSNTKISLHLLKQHTSESSLNWHGLTWIGGTFESDTGGTFHSDMPGTFQSAADGTFVSAIDGTFQSDMSGTFGPMLSVHHLIKPNLPPLILRHNPCIIFSYSSFLFFIDDSNIMRSALPVVVYIR